MTDIVILTPKDLQELYPKLSRDEIYNLLKTKGCPVLPRRKNGTYKVIQSEFESWLKRQTV